MLGRLHDLPAHSEKIEERRPMLQKMKQLRDEVRKFSSEREDGEGVNMDES